MTPEEMVSRVLYRDGLMLVIDKPAGWAVHRGPKGGASLEDYFGALRYGLPRAPALAHRLDRDTSGCLVLGRHRKALAELGRLFKSGRVGKTYWAVVEGAPDATEGRIDLPLGRLDASRGWWMQADPKGQPAVTTWKVMGRGLLQTGTADSQGVSNHASCVPSPLMGEGQGGGSSRKDVAAPSQLDPGHRPPQPSPTMGEGAGSAGPAEGDCLQGSTQLTWLALEPLTGRTHQLRVHCAAMGWPIVGDAIYGSAPRTGGPALQLHSREIVVPLYKNRDAIRVTAPVPPHMREWLTACGWADTEAPSVSGVSS
jgi:tRNA pseudouridine32 synthase / 23S rRNA pseudouridine746 synthase